MQIELRFFANFREAVGQKTVHREYETDLQAGDVLQQLSEEFTEMDLFEDGELREYLTILRNGRDIAHLDGLETALEDGDELSVFPPVAGG
ncbi:ubiquitin-like small modifier protein 1 [Haloarcula sp. NS06]|uniref:ubiquitin-like small modifier protein 1 n=1 Tax=unclassified Haloarcula TaxID=2624677 RepID=UPI0027B2E37D|nr:ubiquitin-like small modifier protein 1 [Haloarcula sp. H-GB4]MDQ2073283.1 ubiquitin-like small modifier protein 1 [Haloarcula sp. H-GB4]